ncbi:hypothetical protein [Mucilaginibacter sp.]|uniref:hypothetical protein n=1 Tax=Mucilaginibacter sp. TaxID=1882438 RepID=UPI000CC4F402|nr:hypothetical protein [Mucilaginibacter sp.]PLW90017.1 MAG: hypothetical protein C0154_08825 [Mucilaginibacter sp.]PMP65811.1 MAG: hypothetical protein C0191_02815 [Mucilaginibacter sp.]
MKKAAFITCMVIGLITKAQAQTIVSAGGVTVKITSEQITYLHGYHNPAIDTALKSSINIKYNSTADLILAILKRKKVPAKDSLYIARQNAKN